MSELRLLNLGCGSHFHPDWTNIDFVSTNPAVIQRDLRRGVGQPDDHFDMVYHSHVLEHFCPSQGRQFLQECFRVLKAGGVMRIAVPDLEQIVRLYLQNLEAAWDGDEPAYGRYEWMRLELLDQMTRHQSGGTMGPRMVQAEGNLAKFIDQRLGREVEYAQKSTSNGPSSSSKPTENWREKWARKTLKFLLGPKAVQQWQVGRFRDSGEVHQWMYDRVSLRQICDELGFVEFHVCDCDESYLDSFVDFELDSIGGRIRKPDSLFVECRKPENVVSKNIAA